MRISILLGQLLIGFLYCARIAVGAEPAVEQSAPHLVFLVSEDPSNYEAHKTIPRFARTLEKEHGFRCTVIQGEGEPNAFRFPGLDVLKEADLLVIFFRRRAIPTEQLELIRGYLKAGKPLVGIRTANHAFSVHGEPAEGYRKWWEFVPEVLGCKNRGYGSAEAGIDVTVASEAADHPILEGVKPRQWHSDGSLYLVKPLVDPKAVVLLNGAAGEAVEPIAWTRNYGAGRVFYTSLGYPDDFKLPRFRRLLLNGIRWALGAVSAPDESRAGVARQVIRTQTHRLSSSNADEFRAGVARQVITPVGPVWMSGYASRDKPSEGVVHDLWGKALALEDAEGRRVVIVATDLIRLPREVSEEIAARAKMRFGLKRDQILLNSSHTHSGPAIWPNLNIISKDIDETDQRRLIEYKKRLIDDLVALVGAALSDLGPAKLEVGHGSADFAVNRRQPTERGYRIGVNPNGPVDHDVPVLRIAAPDGELRAVLFGYACHNTTLGGDYYRIGGDFAGFAQIELEKALPGATAIFLQLCGGDQNPNPRGTVELAEKHGKSLADVVQRALAGKLEPVSPSVRTAFEDVKLDFARQERAVFEKEAKSENHFRKRRAEKVLAALDAGRPVWQIDVPVHAVALGDKLALLTIGGEVVVDYSLRLKREFPQADLIVAGYTDHVICYIPTRRVLREGGYEAAGSTIYFGRPGPFAENVEDKLIGGCRRVLEKIGVKPFPRP